jgi:hypothetical protein
LTLVHVVLPSEGPPWRERQLSSRDRQNLRVARGRLDALGDYARSILKKQPQAVVLLGNPLQRLPPPPPT